MKIQSYILYFYVEHKRRYFEEYCPNSFVYPPNKLTWELSYFMFHTVNIWNNMRVNKLFILIQGDLSYK